MLRRMVMGLLVGSLPLAAWGWNSERLGTPLRIDDETVPYRQFAIYVMPGAPIDVGFVDASGGSLTFQGNRVPMDGSPLQAPTRPGDYPLQIANAEDTEIATIHVFVMVPAVDVNTAGYLNGYRLGDYPQKPLNGLAIYEQPKGFVEVNRDNLKTRISPNFTLGQFVSKQAQDFPKYVVLRPSLLLKLEDILATLNLSGRPTESLYVMSGYRTPWYNRAIGNVPYSRHVWGDACDFYIDENPADGVMDDMDGDGRTTQNDARWLADFIDDMSHRGLLGNRIGGLGVYGSTAAHGPFVHVDVRGSRARW